MKNIKTFLSENFHFLVLKVSVYLNRRVFVMQYNTNILLASKHSNMLMAIQFSKWKLTD